MKVEIKDFEKLGDALTDYIANSKSELEDRVVSWKISLEEEESFGVIGGLLARQCSLACSVASSLHLWNYAFGPVVLRAMAENHINLAWILEDPKERSGAFIKYGLGQAKLDLAHRRKAMELHGEDTSSLRDEELWLSVQRLETLTAVNLGSWSGASTASMAKSTSCELLGIHFSVFSSAVHGSWYNISKVNGRNEIDGITGEKFLVPELPEFDAHAEFLFMAASSLDKTFQLFDIKMLKAVGKERKALRLLSNSYSKWG